MTSGTLLTLLMLSGVAPVGAQQPWSGNRKLTGQVVDEEGKGIRDALVRVVLVEANAGPADLKTDRRGNFEAKNVKPGGWRVEVRADGFAPKSAEATVTAAGDTPRVQVVMLRTGGAGQTAELNRLLKAGDQLFAQARFADARAEYQRVLAERPDELRIHQSIAYTYGREGNHAEALKAFALAGDALDQTGLFLAAASALALDEVATAERYVARVDDVLLTDPGMLINIGVAFLNRNRLEPGLAIFDRVLARFPEAADAYFYRGLGRFKAQQTDGARADLEKFVSLSPNSPQAKQARDLLASIK